MMASTRFMADFTGASSPQEEDLILMDLARRDAMRGMQFEIPDPEEFAQRLPLAATQALLTARHGETGWRVSDARAKVLRPYSLVECRGPHLSAFGIKVRRVLVKWESEQ